MARRVRDSNLESRAAREKLKPAGKPYYRTIGRGLHLGYRKGKLGEGRWVVRRYMGNQDYAVETIATADDRRDADGSAVLDFWQAQDLARKMAASPKQTGAGALTVRRAVEEYIEHLKIKGRSVVDTEKRAQAFIYDQLGNVVIDALTTKQLRDWLSGIATSPARIRTRKGEKQRYRDFDPNDEESVRRRRSTANRTLTVLKAALNHHFREGHVTSDTAWRKVEPFEAVDSVRVRYLQLAEAKRLINACSPDFRPLVQAALLTGARYGELVRLEIQDFNPDSETVTIRRSKSGKSRRIELTDEGAAFFRQHCTGRAGGDLMFKTKTGGAWGASHQLRPMAEACTNARLNPPISFHGLRHTWASLSVMNGMPLMVVAQNLGHADTRMVEKHYGHLAPSYVREAVRKGAPKFDLSFDEKVAPLPARV
jgi:integrase